MKTNSRNVSSKKYQEELIELRRELKDTKKLLSCRFNELAVLTNMLEKTNKDIATLQSNLSSSNEKYESVKKSFSWKITSPIRALSFLLNYKKTNKEILNERVKVIRDSIYFDSEWYLSNNPDVKDSGIDPARHYLLFGGFENRDPSNMFSSEMYLKLHPDVKEDGFNPLEHYIFMGIKENRVGNV